MKIPWTRIPPLLWCYGTTALLIASAVFAVLADLAGRAAPQLLSPPDGYEVPTVRVKLSWSADELSPPFRVEFAKNGEFGRPLIDKSVDQTSISSPSLDADGEYCWRVTGDERSRVSCFRTAKHLVKY